MTKYVIFSWHVDSILQMETLWDLNLKFSKIVDDVSFIYFRKLIHYLDSTFFKKMKISVSEKHHFYILCKKAPRIFKNKIKTKKFSIFYFFFKMKKNSFFNFYYFNFLSMNSKFHFYMNFSWKMYQNDKNCHRYTKSDRPEIHITYNS